MKDVRGLMEAGVGPVAQLRTQGFVGPEGRCQRQKIVKIQTRVSAVSFASLELKFRPGVSNRAHGAPGEQSEWSGPCGHPREVSNQSTLGLHSLLTVRIALPVIDAGL